MRLKSARSLGATVLGTLAFTLLVGTGGAMAQGGGGPSVKITDGQSLDTYGYDPSTVSANVGDTVSWTNTGTLAHTVTAADGTFDSGSLNPGDAFNLTLTTPGTFTYICTPHPWMKATLTVNG